MWSHIAVPYYMHCKGRYCNDTMSISRTSTSSCTLANTSYSSGETVPVLPIPVLLTILAEIPHNLRCMKPSDLLKMKIININSCRISAINRKPRITCNRIKHHIVSSILSCHLSVLQTFHQMKPHGSLYQSYIEHGSNMDTSNLLDL